MAIAPAPRALGVLRPRWAATSPSSSTACCNLNYNCRLTISQAARTSWASGSSEMVRLSLLVGLRSPPRFLLSNTPNWPQAVHRAMAPSSERKSGCDSAVLASWCWPQNGQVVSKVIATWPPSTRSIRLAQESLAPSGSACVRWPRCRRRRSDRSRSIASGRHLEGRCFFRNLLLFYRGSACRTGMLYQWDAAQGATTSGSILSTTVDPRRCFAPSARSIFSNECWLSIVPFVSSCHSPSLAKTCQYV
ncbi:hypothetical protein ACMYR2_2799 [Nitrobacter sp. TKz-YC01]